MPYTPPDIQDAPSTSTPLSAANIETWLTSAGAYGHTATTAAPEIFLGNATSTAFTDSTRAAIPLLADTFHGQVERAASGTITGRPQSFQGFARYFAPTTDDSAEGFSYAVILPNHSDGLGPIVQDTRPVAGGELDVLIQGANEARGYSGRVVGNIGASEAQQSGYIEWAAHFYAAAKSARDAAAATTLSSGATLPVATLSVASAAALPTAGKVIVNEAAATTTVYYTAKAGNTLTGCTGGTGTFTTAATVTSPGSIVRRHHGLYVEKPTSASGAAGRNDNPLGVYSENGAHFDECVTFGGYTGVYGFALNALSIGNTVLTLDTSNGLTGSPGFTGASTVQIGVGRDAEWKVVSSAAAGSVTVAALTKAHAAGALIQTVDSNQVTNLYMLAGKLKTDGSIESGGLNPGNITIRFSNGVGFLTSPEQSSDPTAPSANNALIFVRDNGSGKSQWAARFNTGPVRVLASQGGESPTIASASSFALPVHENPAVFNISGTTNIDTITATDEFGSYITLIFAGILTVGDGTGNIRLSSSFTTSADDTLTLACNGTNWFEVARSVN